MHRCGDLHTMMITVLFPFSFFSLFSLNLFKWDLLTIPNFCKSYLFVLKVFTTFFFILANLIMVTWIVKIVADLKIIFLKQPGSFLFIAHWIELGMLAFCMIRVGKLDTCSIWMFLWCVNFSVLLNLSLLYGLSNQFQNWLWSFH